MFRALHVIRSIDPAQGGPVAGLKMLASVYPKLGWIMEVATLDPPDARWNHDFPATVHALGPGWGRYGFAWGIPRWLQRNAADYDAVIVEGLWQYPGLATWRALAHRHVPYYVFAHGMLDPWPKRAYPLKHIKKWLYWPWAEYRVLRDAEAVLFTTDEERLLARQSFWLYRCNETVVGYGTLAPSGDSGEQRALFQDRFPQVAGKRNILFLGRLHPIKNCDLIIRAFADLARADLDFHLIMAGPDQVGWADELRAIAANAGIADRITWTGALDGDLKWGAFRSADVFIMPSHQESFGVAIAEALACGIPVLISNKVNTWRQIRAAGAGLVEPDNLSGISRLLHGWRGISAATRDDMSQKARHCFESSFEITAAARRLVKVVTSSRHSEPI